MLHLVSSMNVVPAEAVIKNEGADIGQEQEVDILCDWVTKEAMDDQLGKQPLQLTHSR
jgi:hypothetical protein